MIKLLAVIFATILLFVSSASVLAQKPEDQGVSNVPEINGDYPDPDHPGVRVRVFAHPEQRMGKPQAEPAALVCSEDPNSSAFVSWTGWKLPSSAWTYNLNPTSVPGTVGPNNIPTIAASGFNVWQNALASSSAKPTPVRGSDTTINRSFYDGQNIIAWNKIQATALGITYVRYYTLSGIVVDVDTIMNKRYKWDWSEGELCAVSNVYDAQNILTHEQGHWYGLDDEYEQAYVNNTMFGYGSPGETQKNTPTTGDKNGIQAIYP